MPIPSLLYCLSEPCNRLLFLALANRRKIPYSLFMATNGATHYLYSFDTVLDTDTVVEGDNVQPGGVLLYDALCLDGGKVPAGTRIEFRCESRERDTGERVWGVVLP